MELQRANGWAPFSHGQMHYSLLIRDIERDMVPVMERYGLGLTVWSPLVSGFLSGKYTRESMQDKDNRLSGFDIMPYDREHGFQLLDLLREIAGAHKASVAQTAIAWLLAKKVVSSVIVGASKLQQLDDNLAAAGLVLTPAEIASLDEFTKPAPVYPNWFTEFVGDPMVKGALAQG